MVWPDSDEDDQDWIDGIVARLEANVKSVEIDESARTAALTDRKTNRRRDVLKTSKVTDADRRRADRLAPAVAAAIVARAAELELRAREAEVLQARDSVGAQDAAVVMRAVRRSLLADWDYVENQQAFKVRVAQRVAKHLARARKWEEEMAAVGDDEKARVFDDMVRRERLRRVRYRVASEASKRMDETLEAPESVSAWSYVLAWSVVVALQLFFCYIVVPSLLGKTLTEAREARKRGRRGRALPYATELPMGATYYILERHPDLRETPAGIITRAEQEACPGATDARAFVHAIREIAPEPPSSAL